MKFQWGLLLALIFALIIAIFSVINVNAVTVNYLFGHAEWPLILVILGSVLMGALIVGSIGMVRVFRLQRMVKRLEKQLHQAENKIKELSPDEDVANWGIEPEEIETARLADKDRQN